MAETKGKRPGLQPLTSLPQDLRRVLEPLTDLVMRVTGVLNTKIQKLPATASNADVIDKVNEIIARLQED